MNSNPYEIAAMYVATAYIAAADLVAAWLVWKIFGKLGWSPVSRLLASGFTASAISWVIFTSTEAGPLLIPREFMDEVLLFGLLIKCVAVTCIVLGLYMWYKLTTRYKRRK